jgi:membrane-bound lytic murein transglycosylase D
MVTVRCTPAALLAALLAALAFLAAGCSHVATIPDEEEDLVAADEPLPPGTKVDEADIGIAGPAQIEDAIETLDAQTQGQRPLVTELGLTEPGADGITAPTPGDLFERIRTGFVLTDVDRIEIDREQKWFASHPTYLDRTFKRGERYLYHIVNELQARNMPLELALLPVVESAFNPVAYSRARAAGLWQFIPATGAVTA